MMEFTKEQQRVIDTRDCNILVSAAAGSGKTAVLVERILHLIMDGERHVDIDRLLVVTFTNAAAAEMRERIHTAILQRLEEEPDDWNLQKQAVLVHHAQITTIDSFCRFILSNHFQEIDLDPGFCVGDPGRMKLMEKEAMEKVMEAAYGGKELYEGFYADFVELTSVFARKGRDTAVEEMIGRIYHFVVSLPFPKKWLLQALEEYEVQEGEGLLERPFIRDIVTNVSQKMMRIAGLYEGMLAVCMQGDGPEGYLPLLEREQKQFMEGADKKDYEELQKAVCAIRFDRLPAIKKGSCDEEKKEWVKQVRERIKKRTAACKENYFFEALEDMDRDMQTAGGLLKPLVYLTLAFMEQFAKDKEKENLIDFSDMEHFALKILVTEEGEPTDTAKWYQEYFAQVMIDEYQDSNEVQELLLSVISREHGPKPNRFMVGDMKQSIYKFRMARPEIFLEKYHRYRDGEKTDVRIDLKKNFRSRLEVVDMVNHIFYPLMGQAVGGIDYDEDAALYAGAEYPKAECPEAEFLIYEKKDEEENEGETKGENKKGYNGLSVTDGEACMIAAKIKELVAKGRITDKETGGLRPITYDDIVILVRSASGLLESLQDVLKKEGIPASVPSRTGYFSATEVQTLLKLLAVLANPGRDIPLAAVLKSPLYGFTDEELSEISLTDVSDTGKSSLYAKVKLSNLEKAGGFVKELYRYRSMAKTESVHDLLYGIIREHRYLEYVTALPGGSVRRANVEMLLKKAVDFEKLQMHGLFGFLQYMKQLEKYEVDYGTGMDENTGQVRLMTIHKSKGLEFPVCFVAGLSKTFNRRDLSGSLLLHRDLGMGMEYRCGNTKAKRKTLKQKLVAERMKTEELGEELRVLYVALTRAKEKLIMTGAVSDFEKSLRECEGLNAGALLVQVEKRKVEPELILESNSYMKLLLHVCSLYKDAPKRLPLISIYHERDLQREALKGQFERKIQKEALMQLLAAERGREQKGKTLKERIAFLYPHKELEGLYTKTSVSELKLAALHEDEQTLVQFETTQETSVIPVFMQKEKKAKGALRGTAYHRLMELLDFKALGNAGGTAERIGLLEKQVKEAKDSGKMEASAIALVNMDKVEAFLNSSLAKEMMEADKKGKLFKEQPFVMEIAAKRVNPGFPEEETMLIQGIIDAYYEKQGELYLMDYKTDRVNKKEDLIHRYQTQLDYYKEALEKLTGKKVSGVYIYSYHFLESIAF